MVDPKFLISYDVSHLGMHFTAPTFSFWQSQGEPSSAGSGLTVPYTVSLLGGQGVSVVAAVPAGCTLFFYETDGRSGIDHNSIPKHAVWVENSIVQAVPEHPKKDFVFCLSNSLGDAFLFQVGLCKALFCLLALVEISAESC